MQAANNVFFFWCAVCVCVCRKLVVRDLKFGFTIINVLLEHVHLAFVGVVRESLELSYWNGNILILVRFSFFFRFR